MPYSILALDVNLHWIVIALQKGKSNIKSTMISNRSKLKIRHEMPKHCEDCQVTSSSLKHGRDETNHLRLLTNYLAFLVWDHDVRISSIESAT